MIAVQPFSSSQISMLLAPSAWAQEQLRATKNGWLMTREMTDVAMRLTGDIGRDHLPKLQEGDNQEEEDL